MQHQESSQHHNQSFHENQSISTCRHHSHFSQSSRGRRSFSVMGAKAHYAPDLPFKIEHIRLDVLVDPSKKSLKGKVTHRVRVIAAHQTRLVLDQIGLTIERCRVGQEEVAYEIDGHKLYVFLPKDKQNLPVGSLLDFSVRYHVENPRKGFYFTGPTAQYPQKEYQSWSQGQDEDSRYWYPTFDYPNQKATVEVIATVPSGFFALSNGKLLQQEEKSNWVRYHYQLAQPIVTYLLTLVVGRFDQWSAEGLGGVQLQYFVAPNRATDGERVYENTAKMLEVFSQKIGVPYPYEKYAQICVQDFVYGGMENASATTLTDSVLHDERAHLDFSADFLVAHELAHQWFGDLVTCRDWSHGWLNEGFATFMERVWIENHKGPHGGFDEAKFYSYGDLRGYLEEDRRKYRRPIVFNTYSKATDLFDMHLYQKGGLVLNMLRHLLGEDLFWKSIQYYVSRNKNENVETLDLIRAIEDTSGRNMRRIFDEWVFSGGYPEFEVKYSWSDERKNVELVIEQKQTKGAPFLLENGVTTPLFHIPIEIELTFDGGKSTKYVVEVGELKEKVYLPASEKPKMIRFDKDAWIPKTLKFPRPKEMLLYQLEFDADCMGRIEAAKELVELVDTDVVKALGKSLLNDRFWGVQAEVATTLSKIRLPESREALIEGLKVKHPKARKAVVKALSQFPDLKVAEAVQVLAAHDESYFVEAEAVDVWGQILGHLALVHPSKRAEFSKQVVEFSKQKLQVASFREIIRKTAILALSYLPGIGKGEQPEAMNITKEWTTPGKLMDVRTTAVWTLGSILGVASYTERAQIVELLDTLADEHDFKLRMSLIAACSRSGATETIPILRKIQQSDWDHRVKRDAFLAAEDLGVTSGLPESFHELKTEVDRLKQDQEKLRSALDEHKARNIKVQGGELITQGDGVMRVEPQISPTDGGSYTLANRPKE